MLSVSLTQKYHCFSGPTHPPPSDMWQRWNLGKEEVTGDVVEEEPWWQKHGLEIPTPDRELAHIRD